MHEFRRSVSRLVFLMTGQACFVALTFGVMGCCHGTDAVPPETIRSRLVPLAHYTPILSRSVVFFAEPFDESMAAVPRKDTARILQIIDDSRRNLIADSSVEFFAAIPATFVIVDLDSGRLLTFRFTLNGLFTTPYGAAQLSATDVQFLWGFVSTLSNTSQGMQRRKWLDEAEPFSHGLRQVVIFPHPFDGEPRILTRDESVSVLNGLRDASNRLPPVPIGTLPEGRPFRFVVADLDRGRVTSFYVNFEGGIISSLGVWLPTNTTLQLLRGFVPPGSW
jgi:hypothetical protein